MTHEQEKQLRLVQNIVLQKLEDIHGVYPGYFNLDHKPSGISTLILTLASEMIVHSINGVNNSCQISDMLLEVLTLKKQLLDKFNGFHEKYEINGEDYFAVFLILKTLDELIIKIQKRISS